MPFASIIFSVGAKDLETGEEKVIDVLASSGLSVSSDTARSCEILIEEKAGKVLGATYGEGVKGALRRQAPNVAIAISASSDAAFPASVASIQIEGGDAGSVSIKEARCFDAEGAEISDAEVTLK